MGWLRRELRGAARVAVAAAALVAAAGWLADQRGQPMFDGERAAWKRHADAVAAWALAEGGGGVNSTGSERFDGEWDLVSCQMAVLGLGQVARRFPELAGDYRPAMEACLDWMISPEARAFGERAWGFDALDAPGAADSKGPTQAWVGYQASALGMHRLAVGGDRYKKLHDRLIKGLAGALEAEVRTFRTYPGETYPPDQAVVAGAVGLHDLATGRGQWTATLADWEGRFRAAAVDPATGLLVQSLDPADGRRVDGPRGSGTAFAAYFLSFSNPQLSAELYAALEHRSLLGFGGTREYPPGVSGVGDIDSGPVLLGVSVSATGFGLAGSRLHGDRETWGCTWRTVTLFGLPVPRSDGRRWFMSGGALGNAIMLAMLTAGS